MSKKVFKDGTVVIRSKDYDETEERLSHDPIVIAMAHGLADTPREDMEHGETPRFEFMQAANREYRERGGTDGGHIGAVAHALLMVLDRGDVKPTKVVTYYASRSVPGARSDEDAAMTHVDIVSGESSLKEARRALINYMVSEEATGLAKYHAEGQQWATDRMAAIFDAVQQVMIAEFAGDKDWEALSFDADGIRFQLIRIAKAA